jgi:hypothetical protein
LLAIGSRLDLAIRPRFANVAHGALEAGPVVLLLGREAQVCPDARDTRIDLISGLVCRHFHAA